MSNESLSPRFESLKERTVAGLNETYVYATANRIPELWHAFGPMIGTIEGQDGTDSFGIVWNERPGVGFDYLAAVRISDAKRLPGNFKTLTLPAETYAVFAHKGDVSTIPQVFNQIFSEWLPQSAYETTGSPAYERYTQEYNPKTQSGGIEFWVPVKKKG